MPIKRASDCFCKPTARNVNNATFTVKSKEKALYLYDKLIQFYTAKIRIEQRTKQLPNTKKISLYKKKIKNLKIRRKKCKKNCNSCKFTRQELGCPVDDCCRLARENEIRRFNRANRGDGSSSSYGQSVMNV